MIKRKHLRWMDIDADYYGLAESMGRLVIKQKGLRGKSSVYFNPHEREQKAWLNQMTGQVAQVAATLYITGDIDTYVDQQLKARKAGTDYGIDIPPNIDVKSGLMNKNRPYTDPFSQDLLVNPQEFHEDWIYLYVQVHELHMIDMHAKVCIVGWCESDDIEGQVSRKLGVPPGCFGLPAYKLRPIDTLRDYWREQAE